jgi:general secretion pathway protein A
VTPKLVREAAAEVAGRKLASPWPQWALTAAGIVGALALATTAWLYFDSRRGDETAVAGVAAAGQSADQSAGQNAGQGANSATNAATSPAGLATVAAAPQGAGASAAPGAALPVAERAALAPLLQSGTVATGTDQAFAKLFALWSAPFDAAGARPCEQATVQGLECLAQRGTLAQLRLLNRPAIVSLVAPDGSEHQVVVSRLGDTSARIELGGRALDADLNELQRYWFGDFLILWRPPLPGRTLSPGMRGAEVRWLRQGLQQIRGEPARTGASDVYDGELVRLVEDFQRSHRLTVDGIAGQQTQLMLDGQLGAPGTPTLRASGG